jgi:hypothetical protein
MLGRWTARQSRVITLSDRNLNSPETVLTRISRFGLPPPFWNEQTQAFERLINVKIRANGKKSLPALARGQLWKTVDAYIQIVDLGKRLIDYRMMRQLGQSRRTQTSSIETMEKYLKTNEARLVKGNSRN